MASRPAVPVTRRAVWALGQPGQGQARGHTLAIDTCSSGHGKANKIIVGNVNYRRYTHLSASIRPLSLDIYHEFYVRLCEFGPGSGSSVFQRAHLSHLQSGGLARRSWLKRIERTLQTRDDLSR